MNDTVWKTLAKSGPWALLAGVLIAYFLLRIDPVLDAISEDHVSLRAELAEQRAEDAADSKALLNVMGQILMSTERTAYLQRVQCQIAADSPAELRDCARDMEH